jgi:hypothetical protein
MPPAPRPCAHPRGSRTGFWPAPAATRRRPGARLEDAVDLWSRMRAPYELARGRIALAELALETDQPEEAARELHRARAALQGLAIPRELEAAETLLVSGP